MGLERFPRAPQQGCIVGDLGHLVGEGANCGLVLVPLAENIWSSTRSTREWIARTENPRPITNAVLTSRFVI